MAALTENGRTLFPVVVQNRISGAVLMVAFADDEALSLTRETGYAHFYSRSRQALWKKGESSGHVLPVDSVLTDCDGDSFLYLARPIHPVCHRGTPGCFDEAPGAFGAQGMVEEVAAWIAERAAAPPDPTSYTQRQLNGPLPRLLKKIGEEAGEVIIAALATDPARLPELAWESADLVYHLALVWKHAGLDPAAVRAELERRHHPGGA